MTPIREFVGRRKDGFPTDRNTTFTTHLAAAQIDNSIDVGDVLKLPGGDCIPDGTSDTVATVGKDVALIVAGVVGVLMLSLFAWSYSNKSSHENMELSAV